MKKVGIFITAAAFMAACGQTAPKEEVKEDQVEEVVEEVVEEKVYPYHAGADFDVTTAISTAELGEKLGAFEGDVMEDVVLTADINSVCKKKGCWMKLAMADGEEIRVSFKDYEFFVPLDADKHTTTIHGKVFKDTVSVDHLKHLAEDAGETEEEIAKITEPEISWAFEATGVYVDEM